MLHKLASQMKTSIRAKNLISKIPNVALNENRAFSSKIMEIAQQHAEIRKPQPNDNETHHVYTTHRDITKSK